MFSLLINFLFLILAVLFAQIANSVAFSQEISGFKKLFYFLLFQIGIMLFVFLYYKTSNSKFAIASLYYYGLSILTSILINYMYFKTPLKNYEIITLFGITFFIGYYFYNKIN